MMLSVALILSAAIGVPPEPPAQVRDMIETWLADPTTKAPSIAVAAVNRSGILWAGGFGYADLAAKRPVTRSTLFQFASVTKEYTALVLAQLAAEGRIDLDVPITRYLPELQPRSTEPGAPPVTLRSLASHSSGLTNWWGSGTSSYSVKQLLDRLRHHGLTITPGLQFKYSNYGFALIGAALERATGRGYAELVRERVFVPFGLKFSGFYELHADPNLAKSYLVKEGQFTPRPVSGPFHAQTPASGLISSVEDVARFLHAHLDESPASPIPANVKDMLFTAYVQSAPYGASGLAWILTWSGGLPRWYQVGAWNCFYSRLVIRPDVGLGLVITTNGPWSRDLIVPLLKHLAAHADTSTLRAVTGDYEGDRGQRATVVLPRGPELTLELKGHGRLIPISRHTFRVSTPRGWGGAWIRFAVEDGKPVMLWEAQKLVRRGRPAE